MRLEYTPEQLALRAELRDYFTQLMTPELIAETDGNEGGEAYKQVIRQIGKDGWLTLGWPREYGGQGRGPMDQMILFEEAQLANAPLPFVTINTVGPAIIAHGSDEHKKTLLPEIAAGKLHFAIGYSEAEAGTDLAALKTRAIREGENWIIKGSKVYTSSAEAADYIWLAARTDPNAKPQHAGISLFMVSTDQPGFSYSPIHTVGDVRTNVTYYDEVHCPNSMMCGELNQGWKLITSQLNHERVGLAAIGVYAWKLYEQTLAWARTPDPQGQRPIDRPGTGTLLARAYAQLESMRLMNWRMVSQMEKGEPDPAFSSAIKTYGTEVLIEIYRLLMQVLGPSSALRAGSSGAALSGQLELHYRRCQINTFGGGVLEVMRDLVAQFGLGMGGNRRQRA